MNYHKRRRRSKGSHDEIVGVGNSVAAVKWNVNETTLSPTTLIENTKN